MAQINKAGRAREKVSVFRRYLVTLEAAAKPGKPESDPQAVERGARGQIVADGVRRTEQQMSDVIAYINKRGLKAGLGRVGQATAFGMFGIEATPDLVKALQKAPHVESVIPD